MTAPIILFLTLMTLLTASIVLYVANVLFVFRENGRRDGLLALLPLATPVVAFRAGARALPIAFAVTSLLYVVALAGGAT